MSAASIHDVAQLLIGAMRQRDQRPDGQLLDSFVATRDATALEAIIRRHGPMVWSVCRRILRDQHDAEDAFQVTFLVLVRRAASIRPREMVANWLHGVAYQTALKTRATSAKRRLRERQMSPLPETPVIERENWSDLRAILDQEVNGLPRRYRAAFVLCDLEGMSRKGAARQLGLPEGTVASRLARARTMLASRLTRRGVTLSSGPLTAGIASQASAVPLSTLASAIKTTTAIATGQAAAVGAIPASLAAITEGVLKTMMLTKLKTALAIVLVLGMAAFGGGMLVNRPASAQPNTPRTEKANDLAPPPPSKPVEPPKEELPRESIKMGRAVSDYNAIFEKVLTVIGSFFTVDYANRYDGRIESLPLTTAVHLTTTQTDKMVALPAYRRRAIVQIAPATGGGFTVEVRVLKQFGTDPHWGPVEFDKDMEQTILKRLNAADEPSARQKDRERKEAERGMDEKLKARRLEAETEKVKAALGGGASVAVYLDGKGDGKPIFTHCRFKDVLELNGRTFYHFIASDGQIFVVDAQRIVAMNAAEK